MGTLKGSTGRFLNFSAQSHNFTGGSNGPDLPNFPYGQKSTSTKKADINLISKII